MSRGSGSSISGCGGGKSGGQADYRRVLKLAMLVNAALVLVLVGAANSAASLALGGAAVLFLVNATSYGVGFWTVGRDLGARAQALLVKGGLLLAGGGWVIALVVLAVAGIDTPDVPMMMLTALAAGAVAIVAATILFASRRGAASGRAVWLSARREILAMLVVIVAALAVYLTGNGLPDLLVGAALAVYGLGSGFSAIGQGMGDLRGRSASPQA